MITYFIRDNVRGLQRIIREGLGHMMTHQMDRLARDAFLKAPFSLYGDGTGGWSGTGFNAIDGDDRMNTILLEDIRLGLKERDNPMAVSESGGLGETVVCVTSPGVIRDLRFEVAQAGNGASWYDVLKYKRPDQIIAGEVGTYHGTTFVETNNAVLYNAGAITHQANITAPALAGDGAPDPAVTAVDTVEYVGQPDATHWIVVSDSSGFAVGDYVTIHVDRTNSRGVTNGVDYTDGKLHNRRIVWKDDVAGQIAFDRPILEDFKTEISTGVYGYVTKGRHVHTALFLTGTNGVVMGVAQPPIIHTPRPFDDLEMIFRIAFDYYMGWQPFNKNAFEVVYLSGSNRLVGPRY